jgi:hypothetical protein
MHASRPLSATSAALLTLIPVAALLLGAPVPALAQALPTVTLPALTPTPTIGLKGATPTPTATSPIPPLPLPIGTATATATATPVAKPTPVRGKLDVAPNPRLVNFGNVGIQEKKIRPLILINHTTAAVNGLALPMSPPYTQGSPGPFTIQPHSSVMFPITFAPTATGTANSTANFTFTDQNESALMVPVTGVGAPGHLSVQSRRVNFPKDKASGQTLTRFDRLGNGGPGVLSVNIGQMTAPFSVSPSGTQTMDPHSSIPLQISFAPTAPGTYSQQLTITSNDPRNSTVTITVDGDATFSGPTATPTSTTGLPLPTNLATPTSSSSATPTATSSILPLAQSTPSAGTILFAGHELGGTIVGPQISISSQKLGTTAKIYDAAHDAIRRAGGMNNPHIGASSTALPNGLILIAGGGSCVEQKDHTRTCVPTNSAELFNPASNKFSAAGQGSGGAMNAARMGHTATLISGCNCALDGDVLLAGGNGGAESVSKSAATAGAAPLRSAELYDYRNDSFIALTTPMNSAREEAVAVALPGDGGKILIAGGDSMGIFQNSIADAEIFDPTTATFAATAPMGSPRELARAVALDPSAVSGPLAGDVLVTGGFATSGNLAGASLATAELYDPVADAWTPVSASMHSARALHSETLMTTGPLMGQVLITGGVVFQGSGGLDHLARNTASSTELFNPADLSFTPAASMNQSRAGHSAILLDSGPHVGDVLVAGGEKCGGKACTPAGPKIELFDPSAGKWSLSNARLAPPLGAVLGEFMPVQ